MRALPIAAVTLASLSSLACAAADLAPPIADLSLDVYAEPARLVDIGGGRRLNLRCSGGGTPTVILESGQGMSSMAWRKLQPLAAKTRRVCAYDRAGLGFSDAGPLPRSAQAEADDLYALVGAAGRRIRSTAYWDAALSERDADAANVAAVKAAPIAAYAQLPLRVLGAAQREWIEPQDRREAEAAYAKAHRRIAARSARGRVGAVASSGHDIHEDRPGAVAKAIDEVAREAAARHRAK
jgi:pimeloyl-ACP methyl ester carboxylesterase